MRRIYVKRTEHVDEKTGEVKYAEQQSSFFVKSRHFVKMYLDHLYMLKELSGGARCVLDIMLLEMEFNKNTVYVNSNDKERLSEILEKSQYTIRNYIYELEQADVIAKVGTNVYKVNPNLFKKGGQDTETEYEAKNPHGKNGQNPL